VSRLRADPAAAPLLLSYSQVLLRRPTEIIGPPADSHLGERRRHSPEQVGLSVWLRADALSRRARSPVSAIVDGRNGKLLEQNLAACLMGDAVVGLQYAAMSTPGARISTAIEKRRFFSSAWNSPEPCQEVPNDRGRWMPTRGPMYLSVTKPRPLVGSSSGSTALKKATSHPSSTFSQAASAFAVSSFSVDVAWARTLTVHRQSSSRRQVRGTLYGASKHGSSHGRLLFRAAIGSRSKHPRSARRTTRRGSLLQPALQTWSGPSCCLPEAA